MRRLALSIAAACGLAGCASPQDYMHAASRSFLRRFFDGEIAPFLSCFLEREKLTRKEIEELKRILEEKQS